MQGKVITVNLGRTYNTGNYESLRVGVTISNTYPHGTRYQSAFNDLFAEARKALKMEANRILKAIRG